jgi:hypothetical protein
MPIARLSRRVMLSRCWFATWPVPSAMRGSRYAWNPVSARNAASSVVLMYTRTMPTVAVLDDGVDDRQREGCGERRVGEIVRVRRRREHFAVRTFGDRHRVRVQEPLDREIDVVDEMIAERVVRRPEDRLLDERTWILRRCAFFAARYITSRSFTCFVWKNFRVQPTLYWKRRIGKATVAPTCGFCVGPRLNSSTSSICPESEVP